MSVVTLLNAVSANTTGPVAGLGTPYGNLTVSVSTTGTVSAFSVVVQGSIDGFNFEAIGSAITATTAGTSVGSGVLFQYFQGVLSGYSGTGTVTVELAYSLEASPGGGGPPVPQAQTFSLANNAYATQWLFTVTGQTDSPLPSFGLVAGSQTYSQPGNVDPVQGPAFWLGANPQLLSGEGGSGVTWGAAGQSCFMDAGDTNSSGAHGLEYNAACFVTPSGGGATNALQMVGVNDNTNTVNTAIRCGTGTSGSYTSNIVFENSTGSVEFMSMAASGAGSPNIAMYQPAYFFTTLVEQDSTSSAQFTVTTTSSTATAAFTVSTPGSGNATANVESATGTGIVNISGGNTGTAIYAQINFQKSGSPDWTVSDYDGLYFLIQNNHNSSGNYHIMLTAGATYTSAITEFFSMVTMYTGCSMVVNNGGAALATSATTGFLYIPVCAGAPSGTPVAETGSVPLVYDTTDSRLYLYESAAWHYIGMTA